MMRIYLLRHAEAVDDAATDFDRPLSRKGVGQSERVGDFCRANGLIPGVVVHSPVLRAAQTASIVAARWGGSASALIEERRLSCGVTPGEIDGLLSEFARFESIMLVGHQPDLGCYIAHALGTAGPGVHVRKASLTALSGGGRNHALEFSIPVKFM